MQTGRTYPLSAIAVLGICSRKYTPRKYDILAELPAGAVRLLEDAPPEAVHARCIWIRCSSTAVLSRYLTWLLNTEEYRRMRKRICRDCILSEQLLVRYGAIKVRLPAPEQQEFMALIGEGAAAQRHDAGNPFR